MDTVQPLLNGVQSLLNGLNIETSGIPRFLERNPRFDCYHFRLIELVDLIVAFDTTIFLLYQTVLLFFNQITITQMPIQMFYCNIAKSMYREHLYKNATLAVFFFIQTEHCQLNNVRYNSDRRATT